MVKPLSLVSLWGIHLHLFPKSLFQQCWTQSALWRFVVYRCIEMGPYSVWKKNLCTHWYDICWSQHLSMTVKVFVSGSWRWVDKGVVPTPSVTGLKERNTPFGSLCMCLCECVSGGSCVRLDSALCQMTCPEPQAIDKPWQRNTQNERQRENDKCQSIFHRIGLDVSVLSVCWFGLQLAPLIHIWEKNIKALWKKNVNEEAR